MFILNLTNLTKNLNIYIYIYTHVTYAKMGRKRETLFVNCDGERLGELVNLKNKDRDVFIWDFRVTCPPLFGVSVTQTCLTINKVAN